MVTSRAAGSADESFRGLLLRHRGRIGLTQRQLASRMGVHARSIQAWEAGINHPSGERLQALIEVLLEVGAFTVGYEAVEAEALWTTALREAQRMHTPLDRTWLAALLTRQMGPTEREGTSVQVPRGTRTASTSASERHYDWGEAPDVLGFVGRAEEIGILRDCVLRERCRLVAVLGMGGIGKTMVAARLAQEVASEFEQVYWRSVRNAPPASEWLSGAIGFLSDYELVPAEHEAARHTLLLQLLRERRCLLVLDNFETLLQPGERVGRYRDGYAGFGALVQAIGQSAHQSCLLLTSREAPPEVVMLAPPAMRVQELRGLGVVEGQALLNDKQLFGRDDDWVNLVKRFGGNGLALKVAGENVRQVFGGDISAYLKIVNATYGTAFGGIRRLLHAQVERSSTLEQHVLNRLAIEREPVAITDLIADLGTRTARVDAVEALEALRRRSLVEHSQGVFTLQSVVLEHITDRLVEQVADEIAAGRAPELARQPLIRATAKDYVRRSQERLIGQPVVDRLVAASGARGAQRQLIELLETWRGREPSEQGYGPGNVINLLRLLRGELRRMDFSRFSIRQAYLQGVDAQDSSLANAEISETMLGEAFGAVSSISVSADGRCIAAGTVGGDLRVWRLVDRIPLLAIHGHFGGIWGVALSADGQLLASGSLDGTVRLWATDGSRPLATLLGHAGAVARVALSDDGRLVASGGLDGTVRLWDTESRRPLATLLGHSGAAYSVALSADGHFVASGSQDGTVRLWESQGGQPVATLQGHSGAVWGVAFSADGRLLASGSLDGTVRLWDAVDRKPLAVLEGSSSPVWSVAISADGRTVANGSQDGTIRVWDVADGKPRAILEGHKGAVWGVAFSPDGRTLASGGLAGTVRLWEVDGGQSLATLQGHAIAVWGVAFGAEGRLLASSCESGTVELWDATVGKQIASLEGHAGSVYGVTFSADGRRVASGGEDSTVRVWQLSPVVEAAPAPVIGDDEGVPDRLIRMSRAHPLALLAAHTGAVWGVAFSADGRLLASGSVDGTVQLWDASPAGLRLSGGRPLAILHGHTGAVWGVAFSADGRLLASGSLDGTVRLWGASAGPSMNGGPPLAILTAHSGGVWGVAFAADGRRVASGGLDRTVRLWNTSADSLRLTGSRPLATLEGHSGGVVGVALSPDGRLVASGSQDATVRLWDAASGRPLAVLEGHSAGVYGVAFSPDGRTIASGSLDGTAKFWDVEKYCLRRTLRTDRRYERLDITGLSGVTPAQRATLLALGALEQVADRSAPRTFGNPS